MFVMRMLAVCLLSTTLAAPALAFEGPEERCKYMTGKKLEKCEARQVKRLARLRANTRPFQPSMIHKDLARFDATEANPLNSDAFYVGYRKTGIDEVDVVLMDATRVIATVKMAAWVGKLNRDGKKKEAAQVAAVLLPELIKLKDSIPRIQQNVEQIIANPAALVADDPIAALGIPRALGSVVGQLPRALSELPKTIGAVEPLARGAAAAGVNRALGK